MTEIPIYMLTLTLLPLPCFYYIYKRHIQRKCNLLEYSIYGMKMFFLFFADAGLSLLYAVEDSGHFLDYLLLVWSSFGFMSNLRTYRAIKRGLFK